MWLLVVGRLLTAETISVPAMSDGHVIPALTRWTEMADADRSYAFVLRVFYDGKDSTAGRLHGTDRLTIGQCATVSMCVACCDVLIDCSGV